jgi:hypothetical protein
MTKHLERCTTAFLIASVLETDGFVRSKKHRDELNAATDRLIAGFPMTPKQSGIWGIYKKKALDAMDENS